MQTLKRPGGPSQNVPQAKKQKITPPEFTFSQDLHGHQSWVTAAKFSPDGKWLASCCTFVCLKTAHCVAADKTIRLWEAETGALSKTLEGHASGISDLAWTNDCKLLASASDDTNVCIWDVATGRLVKTLRGHTGPAFCVKFNKSGTLLFSGSYDRKIRFWNVHGIDSKGIQFG
jgi:COMPASS component SWD3